MRESSGLDNKQATYSQEELIWLAGFTDGEGSISLNSHLRRKGDTRIQISPNISITNSHMPSIEKVSDILRRAEVGHHILSQSRKGAFSSRPVKRITIWGYKRCARFLMLILPYLFTKKDQAENMWDFIRRRLEQYPEQRWSSKTPYSPEDIEAALKSHELQGRPIPRWLIGVLNDSRAWPRKGMIESEPTGNP